MHRTWRPSASARSRSPTARAVWPPMPASTSSNTSVGGPPVLATAISASITRESSPPDAVSRSGAAGTPGLGAIRNSTCSAPVPANSSRSLQDDLERRVLHGQLGQLASDALGEPGAAFRRAFDSAPASAGSSFSASASARLGALDRHLGVLEPVALGAAAVGVLEHRLHAAAVLALEPVVGVEPLLDLLEPPRLAARARSRSGAARRPGRRPRSAARSGARPARRAPRPRPPPGGEPLGLGQERRGARASSDSGAIASAPPARPRAGPRGGAAGRAPRQRRLLGRVRLERLDLADLEDQQVEVALAVTRARAQVGELAAQLAHARVRAANSSRFPAAPGHRTRRAPRAGRTRR